MTQRISIGFGASSRANCEDILLLIRESFPQLGSEAILATIDRRGEVGERVAMALGLPIVLLPASILSGIRGRTTFSDRALRIVATANVAEASALASLGPCARLIVPRRVGKLCTCAVAVLP